MIIEIVDITEFVTKTLNNIFKGIGVTAVVPIVIDI